RFQAHFHDYDLVLAPTTPVTPFPWTELYLAELEGRKLNNYYHWLSLTYVITLVTNASMSLPCGVDHKGMPFGLQIVGRYRDDAGERRQRLRRCGGDRGRTQRGRALHVGACRPGPCYLLDRGREARTHARLRAAGACKAAG